LVQSSVVKFCRALQPICREDRIIVCVFATFSIFGCQIDRTDAVSVSLREVKFLVGVIIWLALEKRTESDSFVLFIHSAWFS
jgi:hypothetical protein